MNHNSQDKQKLLKLSLQKKESVGSISFMQVSNYTYP